MNPPIAQGGQGRTSQSITDTGWFLIALIVLFGTLVVGMLTT